MLKRRRSSLRFPFSIYRSFACRNIFSLATILVTAGLFSSNLSVQAAEVLEIRNNYKLVYSAEHETCEHFLKLFNSDIAKYGYIEPTAHQEFASVRWKSLGKNPHGTVENFLSVLDINNDGQPDFVVIDSAMLGGIKSDNLFVFRDEPRDFENVGEILRARQKGDNQRVLAAFQRSGQSYNLKMLPSRLVGSEPYTFVAYETVAGIFALHAMRYKDTTYISINERIGGQPRWIDFTHWHVIARYRINFQLDDVCYFEGPQDKVLGR